MDRTLSAREGRVWVTRPEDARPDHLERYWLAIVVARFYAVERVLDVGCGCGYGSGLIVRETGLPVLGVDANAEAIAHATATFPGPMFRVQDVRTSSPRMPPPVLSLAFEVLEHMSQADAETTLRGLPAGFLLCSVPHEDVVPFGEGSHPEHRQHYRVDELRALLERSDWHPETWWGQRTKAPGRVQDPQQLPLAQARTIICLSRRGPLP